MFAMFKAKGIFDKVLQNEFLIKSKRIFEKVKASQNEFEKVKTSQNEFLIKFCKKIYYLTYSSQQQLRH